ncbi:hypothetical protein BASA62_000960 [Batrachochytrium salamandrivorans]|nr:hypothetical protein BASA62_000960 [Batrachochytrium salamandrivorans]
MSSGVTVNDAAVSAYQDLKIKKKFRFITFQLSKDCKEIQYAVFDFCYDFPGSEVQRTKILFYVWSPDGSKIKQKMLYAASKDALRKKLDGTYTEIQCTDASEVSYETVLEKVLRATS